MAPSHGNRAGFAQRFALSASPRLTRGVAIVLAVAVLSLGAALAAKGWHDGWRAIDFCIEDHGAKIQETIQETAARPASRFAHAGTNQFRR